MEVPVEMMEKSADVKENIISLARRSETYSAHLEEMKERKEGEEPYVGNTGQQ